jgi:hypothetical protein
MSFLNKVLRSSRRGFLITGNCLGRRFRKRGSTWPGRDGLTTGLDIASPGSASSSHRSASMKLIRSTATRRDRRTPWAQVVLAQRTLSDLNEDYIEALLELRKSEVTIRGMLLGDGLSQPEPPTPGGHIDATPQPR